MSEAATIFRQVATLPVSADEQRTKQNKKPFSRRQSSLYRAAQLNYQLQKFDLTIELCRGYRDEYPKGSLRDVFLILEAKVQSEAFGNVAFAQRLYNELLENFSQSKYVDDAQFFLASSYETAGEFEMARKQWQRFLERYPASDSIQSAQNRLRLLNELTPLNSPEMITRLTESLLNIKGHPDSQDLILQLAEFHFQRHDYETSTRYCRKALKSGSEQLEGSRLFFLLGKSYFQLGERAVLRNQSRSNWDDSAKVSLQTVITGESTESHTNKARELLALMLITDSTARTIENLMTTDSLLASSNNNPRLNNIRLWAAITRKQLISPDDSLSSNRIILALQKLATAQNIKYNNIALLELADWYWQMGNLNLAMSTLEQLRLSSHHDIYKAKGTFLLANWLAEQKQYDQAITALTSIQEKYYYSTLADSAQTLIVRYLIASGQHSEALKAMNVYDESDNLLANSNTVHDVNLTRAKLFERTGNDAKAIQTYLRFINTYSDAPETAIALLAAGRLSEKSGTAALAIEYYNECIQRFPITKQGEQARFQLGELYFNHGNFLSAKEAFQILLKEHPKSFYIDEAIKKMILCLYKIDMPTQAEAEIKKNKQRFEEAPSILAEFEYAKGELALEKKRFLLAKRTFENLDKKYRETQFAIMAEYGLAKTLLLQNKTEEALKKLTAIPGRYPEHPFFA